MKKSFYCIICTIIMLSSLVLLGQAQTTPVNDQNPNYMQSRDKYMKMADSLNALHGTTPQETYKAIDYLIDKREAKMQRKQARLQRKWERARGYYNYNDYYSGYNQGYYYRPYTNSYYGNYWGNYLWNTLPLALTLGYWFR